MLKATDLRTGKYIVLEGATSEILEYHHKKIARGGAMVKIKIKNLESGEVLERTLRGQEKVEEANISFTKCQFLYSSDDEYFFMNSKDFNQFSLDTKMIGNKGRYLKEGDSLDVVFSGDKPININLPVKIFFEVIESQPGVKGDTQSTATKEVMVETGYKVQVPLFINKGEKIIIDTRDGKYIERAN